MIHQGMTTRSRHSVQSTRPLGKRGEAHKTIEHLCDVIKEAFSVAVSILQDAHKAEEVVEEAVLEMTNSEPKSLDRSDFGLRLMRNVAQRGINLLAEQHGESDQPGEQNPPPGAVEMDPHHYEERPVSDLKVAIDRLPPLHRAVVRLHYVAGFSFDDVTHLMSTPERNARTLMAEAYKMLMSSYTIDSVGLSSSMLPPVG
jgi:DNA-directed RNA polymerase specialized sigma24 family protein